MRLSRLISAPNWRYAVGEVVLIVVGVTIALAGTSWYEGRQERRDEILVLQQLRQTLSEDLVEIESIWESTRRREQNIMALLDHLESNRPYAAELARNFQSLLGWRTVRIKTAPFEVLKVQGYTVVTNTILREKLISFYEDHYAMLEYSSFVDREFAIEKVQPYFFENLVMRVATSADADGGFQDWEPRDYDKIRAEGYIANLCRFRADILRRFDLRHYQNTTALMHEVLEILDQELATAN